MEIEELQAELQAARSKGESEDAPSASHENGELERLDVLEHEIAAKKQALEKQALEASTLKQELEATKRELAKAEAAGAEAARKSVSFQAKAEEAQEELRALQRIAAEKSSSAEAGPLSYSEGGLRRREGCESASEACMQACRDV